MKAEILVLLCSTKYATMTVCFVMRVGCLLPTNWKPWKCKDNVQQSGQAALTSAGWSFMHQSVVVSCREAPSGLLSVLSAQPPGKETEAEESQWEPVAEMYVAPEALSPQQQLFCFPGAKACGALPVPTCCSRVSAELFPPTLPAPPLLILLSLTPCFPFASSQSLLPFPPTLTQQSLRFFLLVICR